MLLPQEFSNLSFLEILQILVVKKCLLVLQSILELYLYPNITRVTTHLFLFLKTPKINDLFAFLPYT